MEGGTRKLCGDRNILYLDYGDGYRSFGSFKTQEFTLKTGVLYVSK